MAGLRDLQISQRRILPEHMLSVRFSRSGGPGGQNVNKVSSKVDLRLDLNAAAEILGETNVALVREKLANRLDAEGNLQVISSESREQAKNIELAISRMESLLKTALIRQKKRRSTKPSRGSKERRLKEKKQRSQVKKWRSSPED